ncbi:MAG: radical SAM protein [Desulfobacterales bacterium]|nr:MAG: radical SAM protein [Desulfobacterales bacterium]
MELIGIARRSPVLTRTHFGCLRSVYTLNVTRGCEFRCVYCYARGYPAAPPAGTVHLFGDLPARLAQELDRPRRRKVIDGVAFNTASDSFQTHPRILDITYQAMQVLLDRGIGLSFLTKGWIPDRFGPLFADHPGLVAARIGLVSLRPHYRDLFEPHAATAAERLQNIERLIAWGIPVEVRIDPIIPFVTDDEASIRELYEALAARGIRTVSLSYLHLRPALLDQLQQELPPTELSLIGACFKTRPWSVVGASTRSKLMPRVLRQKGYARFMGLAPEFGIKPFICACKNPDLPAHLCTNAQRFRPMEPALEKKARQLSLFGDERC